MNSLLDEANARLVKSQITFVCRCGQTHTKSKYTIQKSGPYCKDCTQRNASIKRIKAKIALNNALLEAEDTPKD